MDEGQETAPPSPLQTHILRVLWLKGGLTVNEVHAELLRERPNTTRAAVLRAMQVMAAKQLLRRDKSRRSHVYFAAPTPSQTDKSYFLGRLVRDVKNYFSGSFQRFVLGAMDEFSDAMTPEELDEVSRKIEELKRRQAPSPRRRKRE